MVADGSVRARRAALPAPLAPVAVLLGVLAMRAGFGALTGLGLGLRPTLVLCELLLVLPGLALVALVRAPLRRALALLPLPGRAVFLSLAAGLTLWGASLGLFSLQYVVWPPPDGYLEAFRQLHDALRPKGPADAFLSMHLLQRACEVQLLAQAGGRPLISVDPRITAGVKENVIAVTRGLGGGLAWPGLLRKLDRLNPGYAD